MLLETKAEGSIKSVYFAVGNIVILVLLTLYFAPPDFLFFTTINPCLDLDSLL